MTNKYQKISILDEIKSELSKQDSQQLTANKGILHWIAL